MTECLPCRKQRDAAFNAIRSGDAPALTRALTEAARINAQKAVRIFYNVRPEPWKPPITITRWKQPYG